MADVPHLTRWLTIVGLGEDGPDGLSRASLDAISEAAVVMGARRHLALLPEIAPLKQQWPEPFADGIPVLLAHRGKKVVLLASGDPFWFGAGTSVTRHLAPEEWLALPSPPTFGLAAARLGWPLEEVLCLGLHAAPLDRLFPHLAPSRRILVLVRDGAAAGDLAVFLTDHGFGPSVMKVMERLGGPLERVRTTSAEKYNLMDVGQPVAVAIVVGGDGRTIPLTTGRPDDLFEHDGQITKRPIRALTMSALAPRAGELLWDIGAGSGSIGIEWLLAHASCRSIAIEADPDRAARLRRNADRLGVDRLQLVTGSAPQALDGLQLPDAVFVGGGASDNLFQYLWGILPKGCRLVANAVTLESEALLTRLHSEKRGALLRIELAEALPLGRKHGWRAAFPVVQWSVVR